MPTTRTLDPAKATAADRAAPDPLNAIRHTMNPGPHRLLIHHDHAAITIGEPTRAASELLDAGTDPHDLPEQLAHANATTITHARNRRILNLAMAGAVIALAVPAVCLLSDSQAYGPGAVVALVLAIALACRELGEILRTSQATGNRTHEQPGSIHPDCELVPPVADHLATVTPDDMDADDLNRIARLAATHGTPCGGEMLLQGEATGLVMSLVSAAAELNEQRQVPGITLTQCPAFDSQTHARAITDAFAPTPIPADLQQLWVAADGHTLKFTVHTFAGQLPTLRDTLTRVTRRP